MIRPVLKLVAEQSSDDLFMRLFFAACAAWIAFLFLPTPRAFSNWLGTMSDLEGNRLRRIDHHKRRA